MANRTSQTRRRHKALSRSLPDLAPAVIAEAETPVPEAVPVRVISQPSTAFRWHVLVAVVVTGLSALLYARTVDFPMVFDDYVYLETNPLVRDGHNFAYWNDFREFATRPAKMGLPPDLATNFILRPVAYATFHLNFLCDGFRPRWFRLTNIAVHAANGLLIYGLLTCLLGQGMALARRSVIFIAATSALLFVAHPMATESVTYIVQRFTSLGTLFYLLPLWLHFAAYGVEHRGWRHTLRGAAVITLLLGMLTKESTVTAPLVAVMLDWLLFRHTLKKALITALPLLLCLPVIPVLVVLCAWAQNDGALSLTHAMNVTNLNERPWDHWQYIITQFTVVGSYLRRLIWPTGLNLDPQWPLYRSILEGPVLRALFFMLAMVGTLWGLRRAFRHDGRYACALAFVLWFFATIVVSSGLVPLPDLMAEHRAYLPSIGIFVAIACLLDRLGDVQRWGRLGRWLAPALGLVAIVALSCATWQRNQVWRNPVALWEDTVSKSPGSSRVWSNLGASYSNTGRYAEAAHCFQESIRIEPLFQTAYLNLASVENALHHSQIALDAIAKLSQLNKDAERSPDVQCNRGIALIETGRVEEGTRLLNTIITHVPNHRMSHVVLGMIYSQMQQPRKAMEHYRRAVALQPPDPQLASMIHNTELAANASRTESE